MIELIWIEYLVLFILGTMAGSFLNVIIYRVPDGASIAFPASHCLHCGRPIKPWENIPVISYIFLRGKCKGCKVHISFQYPLVEISMGLLVAFMHFAFGFSWDFVIYSVLAGLLLALSVIDLKTYRLPDPITMTGAIMAVALTLLLRREFWLQMLLGGAVGVGVMGLQGLIGMLIMKSVAKKGGTLGLGDVKFAGMIGLFLGPGRTGGMYIFAIFLGAIFGLTMIALGGRRFGQKIPFGPYIAAGALVSLVWGEHIWRWYSSFLR